MAKLGLDANRFTKGDPRDINHFFPILGTSGEATSAIGTLSLYSNGTATVMEDATGRLLSFESHGMAMEHALAM